MNRVFFLLNQPNALAEAQKNVNQKRLRTFAGPFL